MSLRQFKDRQMLRIAHNAIGSRGAHVATPADKATSTRLERKGLVTIERTKVRCAGYAEWWVSITQTGVAALVAAGAVEAA